MRHESDHLLTRAFLQAVAGNGINFGTDPRGAQKMWAFEWSNSLYNENMQTIGASSRRECELGV